MWSEGIVVLGVRNNKKHLKYYLVMGAHSINLKRISLKFLAQLLLSTSWLHGPSVFSQELRQDVAGNYTDAGFAQFICSFMPANLPAKN